MITAVLITLILFAPLMAAAAPQGTALLDKGAFTWASGGTGLFYDAVFQTSAVDTKFTGEAGRAPWLADLKLDARGFGAIVDLSVAMSNDFAVGEAVASASAAMTEPKLKMLLAQAGEALGPWGQALELTRELVAVKLATVDGKTVLADRAIYVEDAGGGYWKLKSGAAIVDGAGQTLARATLEDVLAQGSDWRLEQMFSPSTRGSALTERAEVPYLVKIESGRARFNSRCNPEYHHRGRRGEDMSEAMKATLQQLSALPLHEGLRGPVSSSAGCWS